MTKMNITKLINPYTHAIQLFCFDEFPSHLQEMLNRGWKLA